MTTTIGEFNGSGSNVDWFLVVVDVLQKRQGASVNTPLFDLVDLRVGKDPSNLFWNNILELVHESAAGQQGHHPDLARHFVPTQARD